MMNHILNLYNYTIFEGLFLSLLRVVNIAKLECMISSINMRAKAPPSSEMHKLHTNRREDHKKNDKNLRNTPLLSLYVNGTEKTEQLRKKECYSYNNNKTLTKRKPIKKQLPKDLSPEYHGILVSVREKLIKILENDKLQDDEIIRHIITHRGNYNETVQSLVDLINWRRIFSPEKLDLDLFRDYSYNSVFDFLCLDKYLRPVLILRACNINTKKLNVEIFLKYVIYILETSIQKMGDQVDKIILLVDLKGFIRFDINGDLMEGFEALLHKYYPERLAYILFINEEANFKDFWSELQGHLSHDLINSIVFVRDHINALKPLIEENAFLI